MALSGCIATSWLYGKLGNTLLGKWRFLGQVATYAVNSKWICYFIRSLSYLFAQAPRYMEICAEPQFAHLSALLADLAHIGNTLAFFPEAAHDINPMIGLPASLAIFFGNMSTLYIINPINGICLIMRFCPSAGRWV